MKKRRAALSKRSGGAQAAPLKPLTKSGALAPEPPCGVFINECGGKFFAPQCSKNASGRVRRFDAPHGLIPQGFAQC